MHTTAVHRQCEREIVRSRTRLPHGSAAQGQKECKKVKERHDSYETPAAQTAVVR